MGTKIPDFKNMLMEPELAETEREKYVGVILDSVMKVSTQCTTACKTHLNKPINYGSRHVSLPPPSVSPYLEIQAVDFLMKYSVGSLLF